MNEKQNRDRVLRRVGEVLDTLALATKHPTADAEREFLDTCAKAAEKLRKKRSVVSTFSRRDKLRLDEIPLGHMCLEIASFLVDGEPDSDATPVSIELPDNGRGGGPVSMVGRPTQMTFAERFRWSWGVDIEADLEKLGHERLWRPDGTGPRRQSAKILSSALSRAGQPRGQTAIVEAAKLVSRLYKEIQDTEDEFNNRYTIGLALACNIPSWQSHPLLRKLDELHARLREPFESIRGKEERDVHWHDRLSRSLDLVCRVHDLESHETDGGVCAYDLRWTLQQQRRVNRCSCHKCVATGWWVDDSQA